VSSSTTSSPSTTAPGVRPAGRASTVGVLSRRSSRGMKTGGRTSPTPDPSGSAAGVCSPPRVGGKISSACGPCCTARMAGCPTTTRASTKRSTRRPTRSDWNRRSSRLATASRSQTAAGLTGCSTCCSTRQRVGGGRRWPILEKRRSLASRRWRAATPGRCSSSTRRSDARASISPRRSGMSPVCASWGSVRSVSEAGDSTRLTTTSMPDAFAFTTESSTKSGGTPGAI